MINHTFQATKRAAAVLLLLAFSLPALAAEKLAPVPAGPMQSINETELRLHLEFLADPAFGGRYALHPSFKVAAVYLATRLKNFGYKPAAPNGSYLQTFDFSKTRMDAEKASMSLTLKGEKTDLKYGQFYNASTVAGSAQGNLVFAGYGYSTPDQKHDDYANLDVKGKIVVIVSGTPANIDPSLVKDDQEGVGAAEKHGAAGVIVIPSPRYLRGYALPNYMDLHLKNESIGLDKAKSGKIPMIRLHPTIAEKVLAQLNTTVDAINTKARNKEALAPQALEGSAQFTVGTIRSTVESQNVVGILEGTDPKLKDEYICISAHYDTVTDGGKTVPGADDDGSGTVSILNIAKAFAMQRPKRSVLVIFHSGEELGLLGAEYNTDIAPAVPLNKIVANLNIDMIGRSKKEGDTSEANKQLTPANTIYVVGSNRISTELHNIHEATNNQYTKVKLDYLLNDPKHPERIYFRSDHWNYAKHGIPVIFWFDGVHEDYHKTTDTIDKIDFQKMTNVARLVYATGWRVANKAERLKIDNPSGAQKAAAGK